MSQSLSETAYGMCPVFLGGSAKMLLLLTCTRQPGRGIGGVWNGELSEFHELFEDRTWWTGSKEVSKKSLGFKRHACCHPWWLEDAYNSIKRSTNFREAMAS